MTRPLRLLLSSHGASPFGAERVLLILAEGLAARGHEITLELPHEGPALEEARRLDGVRVVLSGRPRLPRNVSEALRYVGGAPAAAVGLWRRIRKGDFDAVWVNSLFNPLAALAARVARTGVVWHIHERNFRFVGPLPGGLLVRALADVPVPVSGFVADTFTPLVPRSRSRVLFERFPELPALPLREERDELVVGYVGQFEPRKRVPDLLEALAAVEGVRGLVVGDGKRRHEVEAAVRRLGLEGRVELPGFQRDIVPFYRRMDCVVIPSRDEPCPLVAFEAMSTGRPVVASRHGGHPEVLGEAALFFELGDTEGLARQISRLRDDPALARSLRARGLQRVASFDRAQWLDDAEAIVREAVRRVGNEI